MEGLLKGLTSFILTTAILATFGCSSHSATLAATNSLPPAAVNAPPSATANADAEAEAVYAKEISVLPRRKLQMLSLVSSQSYGTAYSPENTENTSAKIISGHVVRSKKIIDPTGDAYYGVKVLYGTNRLNNGSAGYGTEISGEVSYGSEVVLIPVNRERGEYDDSDSLLDTIVTFFRQDKKSKGFIKLDSNKSTSLSQDEMLVSLKNYQEFGYGDILIFVHGFNVGFYDAVKRTAQLVYDLDTNVQPVLFSWPSQADPTKYVPDNRLAGESVKKFRDFLEKIESSTDGRKIHVLAHSMGSQIVIPAIADLYTKDPSKFNDRFGNIIFAAPDFDRAYFKREYSQLFEDFGKATIYMSSDDRALSLSSNSHLNDGQRLGYSGKYGFASSKIDAIDITRATAIGDILGHSRYGNSSRVLNDMHYMISNSLRANERYGIDINDNPAYYVLKP